MTVLDDFRYSAPLLFRPPAFATAAVPTLGHGIGTGTAVFSAVDTILSQPPQLVGLIRDWKCPTRVVRADASLNLGDAAGRTVAS